MRFLTLLFALAALAPQMHAATLSSASVSVTGDLPNPDHCSMSSTGALVFCQSAVTPANVAQAQAYSSFGNLGVLAGVNGNNASAFAHASFDGGLSFGDYAGIVTIRYQVSFTETFLPPGGPGFAFFSLSQGNTGFSLPSYGYSFNQIISLSSMIDAGQSLPISASATAGPSTPGNEVASISLNLMDVTLATPEPSSLALLAAGVGAAGALLMRKGVGR